eukprot:scaffold84525_cov36-Prasinocladus_malaysianus.AAC.2
MPSFSPAFAFTCVSTQIDNVYAYLWTSANDSAIVPAVFVPPLVLMWLLLALHCASLGYEMGQSKRGDDTRTSLGMRLNLSATIAGLAASAMGMFIFSC